MKKLLLLTLISCFPARLHFIIVMMAGVFTFAFAGDDCIPSKPSPFQLVNNFSKELPEFLSVEETEMLEQKLQNFNWETSNQIVIVIVDDLCGYDANEFSTRLGEQWGVGQGKFDNGIVIMVKPTGGAGQRDAYIASGYGLEGIIPDVTAKRIVENEIIPRFKNGDFYGALDASADVLISLAKKEFSYSDYQTSTNESFWTTGTMVFLFIIIYLLYVIVYNIFNKNKKGQVITGSGSSQYGGGWSSWGGGGWSSSGDSGFGGFGGGSFGGGGAGGKW